MKVKFFVFAALLCSALFGMTSCTQNDEPATTGVEVPIDNGDILDEEVAL